MPKLKDEHNIIGQVQPGFERVYDVFLDHFENDAEAGAGVCVMRDGEFLVDLTGGTKDRKKSLSWEPNTLVQVYSSTKAIAALIVAWLVENRRLDYELPIFELWPEFAAHGKGVLTIGQIMSHQSGLSGLTSPIDHKDWLDHDKICDLLANQEPIWEPGTASGYHPLTYGFLAGEIARRADEQNRSLGTILREEFCAPHDIDFHIGMSESDFDRCADLHRPRSIADLGEINAATKAAFMEKWSSTASLNLNDIRKAELPASNGHGTAKSMARLMQLALDGKIGDTQYLNENTLYEFSKTRVSGPNLVLPFEITFAAGVMVNHPNHF